MAVDGPNADLLASLRADGIGSPALEEAIASVDLRDYVSLATRDAIRSDRWLPLECGQSMTPARVTARMIVAAEIEASHSVLEIGTGSGYQTALLARMARKVMTLERYRTLTHSASRRLTMDGISNAAFLQRDGSVPHRDGILYDRIIIDSAFEQVPRHYIDMLVANGVLVCAVGPLDGEQQLLRLTKIGSRFERRTLGTVRFNALEKGVATAL